MSCRTPNPASLSHDERMQYRTAFVGIFKQGEPDILQDGSALYTCDKGERFYLHAFAGKALRLCRQISGYYRSAARRDEAIERFKQERARLHTDRMLRRQAAKRPHTLNVGDVLNTSWGYDQTSVEFYEVVAVSGSMVTLREIAGHLTETGCMNGKTMATPGCFIGEPIRRRDRANNTVKIHVSACARPWNGRPKYVSWYG